MNVGLSLFWLDPKERSRIKSERNRGMDFGLTHKRDTNSEFCCDTDELLLN